jgi:hypothetical protein
LNNFHIKRVLRKTQRQKGCPHPRNVTVVVGTKEIVCLFKTAIKFTFVVGYIDEKIGRFAFLRYQNPVFFIAKFRCLEPQRPVFFIGQIFLFQNFQYFLFGIAGSQFTLVKKIVEMDPEIFKNLFLIG